MSGFVPAGHQQAEPSQREAEWTKVRNEVDKQRLPHPEQGKQDGGKSLYEVLQANKAAKQDAFEESIKLKNQFRPLDDDEVDFLDSVLAADRAKEAAVKRETAEQVEVFRKQRQAAEQTGSEDPNNDGDSSVPSEVWAARKRRRKDKAGEDLGTSKIRRRTSSAEGNSQSAKAEPKHSEFVEVSHPSNESSLQTKPPTTSATGSGLGLDAYSSDDD